MKASIDIVKEVHPLKTSIDIVKGAHPLKALTYQLKYVIKGGPPLESINSHSK